MNSFSATNVSTVEPGAHARHGLIAGKLSAHHVRRIERAHRLQQSRLLIAHRLVFFPGRRVHCQLRQDLQHVVLHHVADRAGFVVEVATVLDAKILRHGDLDAATCSRFQIGSNIGLAKRV